MTTIACEVHGAARLLRFSAPPTGILTASGARDLHAAFEQANADSDARAIIIAGGDPGVFIRHYDLASIGKAAKALRDGFIDGSSFPASDFAQLTGAIAASPLPVIAAINGICMGGGFEIALACDIRIAGRDVEHIGLPEMRVDIFPGGGGTQRLARIAGEGAALDMALRGRTVNARRAHELGIVSDIADDAVNAALELAEAFARHDREALAITKHLVRGALDTPLAAGLEREGLAFADHIGRSHRARFAMEDCLASGTMLEDVRF